MMMMVRVIKGIKPGYGKLNDCVYAAIKIILARAEIENLCMQGQIMCATS